MKKITLSVFFAAAMIIGVTAGYTQNASASATANEQINTPNATSDNVMQLLDAYYGFGAPIDIELVIYNNQEFVAFQLDVPLPEEIGYVAGSAALNPERIVDHFIQSNVLPGTNILRMISFSLTNSAYPGNEGVIATFTVTHPDWPVDWLLPIENGIMATIEGVNILDYTIPGTITYGPIYFTVTFDVMDAFTTDPISDASITFNGITNDPGDYVFENIEPGTYDYSVTAEGYEPFSGSTGVFDDLTVTVPLQLVQINNVMQIVDNESYAGENVDIDLVIFNDQEFVAFQLDVPLPEGFGWLQGAISLNPDRIVDHLIQANVLPGTNILRMISFSLTNSAYIGSEGVIASFTLTTPNIAGEYLLEIEGGIMVDIEGTNILTGTIPGTITLSGDLYTVTFDVQDPDGELIDNATITLGDITNEPGDYVFPDIPPGIYFYSITGPGYLPVEGQIEVIDDNLTVIVTVQWMLHSILATSGENGSIEPSGLINITQGSNQLFTITPDEGYHVDEVLVDGVNVGAVAAYEFVNITDDHTIHASFAINIYNIAAEPNNPDWGSIAGAGFYEHGQTVTLTATANPNYEFIEWHEDGFVVSTDAVYVFTALADRNLVAIFDFVDGIPGADNHDLKIRMYPNPATGIVHISLNNKNHHIETVRLFDMHGNEVLSMDYPGRADVYPVDIRSLMPGIYLVRAISADGIANLRLIVM